MRGPLGVVRGSLLLLLSVVLTAGGLRAADIRLEALLVWATNEGSSPKPEHRPIEAELKNKFDKVPFKFKNYFEEKRVPFALTLGATNYTRVTINDGCYFDSRDLGNSRVKVKLYGKNKEVIRHEEPLPPGETLILAGDAKDDHSQSAWFIVIRHARVATPAPKPAGK